MNRSFHCVNRFQNPQSKRIMADAWMDRTNGCTFQVKRSSSKPTSTISVVNLYVERGTVQLIRRLFNLLWFIRKMIANLPPLNVNSTRHSPMGNTRTKWRKSFIGKVKDEKCATKKNKFVVISPSLFLVFHLQECRFVISSTYPTLLRCQTLFVIIQLRVMTAAFLKISVDHRPRIFFTAMLLYDLHWSWKCSQSKWGQRTRSELTKCYVYSPSTVLCHLTWPHFAVQIVLRWNRVPAHR